MKLRRHRLLAFTLALNSSLLMAGVQTAHADTSTSAVTTPAETAPVETQAVAAATEDSETDRGWIGIVTLLGAASVMVAAIVIGVNLIRKRK